MTPEDQALLTQISALDAIDDADWLSGVEWLQDMEIGAVLSLRLKLVDDDPGPVIAWMQEDHAVADVIQRLALLALDEIIKRHLRRQVEDREGLLG